MGTPAAAREVEDVDGELADRVVEEDDPRLRDHLRRDLVGSELLDALERVEDRSRAADERSTRTIE